GWVPAQCARSVDKWLNFHENPPSDSLKTLILPRYSFCQVTPCELPMAYEHDMSGAYWQIVKMAPSPRVIFNKSRIGVCYHQSMDPERRSKWERMVDMIAPHKDARLAIVGNWVGRYGAARW